MNKADNLIISFLACILNQDIVQAIEKNYEIKFQKLNNINQYINTSEFKSKIINETNFNQCVQFTIKEANNDEFRNYLGKKGICALVIYKKDLNDKKILNMSKIKSSSALASLKGKILKYEIQNDKIILYINPLSSYKEMVLEAKDDIIEYYKSHHIDIKEVCVKYIYENKKIDEDGETLLQLGYVLKNRPE